MTPDQADRVQRGEYVTWHDGVKRCVGTVVRRATVAFAPAFAVESLDGTAVAVIAVQQLEKG
jgi:hypothetical protein